jgi:FKBP-type peptidyl-prolyl cis-trans isomerase FklB
MMRKWAVFLGVALLAVPAKADDEAASLKSERDRMSYAVGVSQGRLLRRQGANKTNLEMVIKGLRDEFGGKPLAMTEHDFRLTIDGYQQEMARMMGKARQIAAMENKEKGDAFLASNLQNEGVKILPSGLQYQVLNEGSGAKPQERDTVTCHYRGTLIDGVEIDSTWRRNQPATFEVEKAIGGWREALPLMAVGSKWKLFIPPELAYSKQSVGEYIGPNSTLVFELELLSIKKE